MRKRQRGTLGLGGMERDIVSSSQLAESPELCVARVNGGSNNKFVYACALNTDARIHRKTLYLLNYTVT